MVDMTKDLYTKVKVINFGTTTFYWLSIHAEKFCSRRTV